MRNIVQASDNFSSPSHLDSNVSLLYAWNRADVHENGAGGLYMNGDDSINYGVENHDMAFDTHRVVRDTKKTTETRYLLKRFMF